MENKFDTVICLRIGKTSKAKTPSGDFNVTTPENSLLSKQMITSKGISVSYTNLQLNPFPNTQLTCSIVTISTFQCTAPSTWFTNRCMDPSTWLTTNLRRMLVAKFFNSSTRWRSRNSLVTKPNGVQTWQLLQEKDERGQILSPVTICMNKTLAHTCATFYGP